MNRNVLSWRIQQNFALKMYTLFLLFYNLNKMEEELKTISILEPFITMSKVKISAVQKVSTRGQNTSISKKGF